MGSARLRKKLLKTKTPLICIWCGKAVTEKNWSVEHIVPKSIGGTDDITNLAWAHTKCNNEMGRELWIKRRNSFDKKAKIKKD